MILLAVKLLLAPCFVMGASLVARRFGPRIGGLTAGLPVVAGPILLAYAIEHGRQFASTAAAGTLTGLVSLIAFVVVYGRLGQRVFWARSMLSGWLAFACATAVFSAIAPPLGVSLAMAAVALATGLAALPRPRSEQRIPAKPPRWDLPLRAACAAALVLTLTAVAGWLGPQVSGLLAPFPIIATVMATFTHAQRGTEQLMRLLRGLLSGFGAFALFCFSLALLLRDLSTAESFLVATSLALLAQATVMTLSREKHVRPAAQGVLASQPTDGTATRAARQSA
ncbi:MAG: hypothetical protein ACRDJX_08370 [Solirubrobacteraceae bacterium]